MSYPNVPVSPGPQPSHRLADVMPQPSRPRRRWPLVLGASVAVVVALGAGAGIALALNGDTEPASTSSAPLDQPKVTTEAVAEEKEPQEARTLEAAREAAQRGWDRFTAGDYAGTWDTYGKGVKDRISQADYVKVFKACNEALGTSEMFAVQVEDPRWFNDAHTKVTVTVKHPLVNATRTMVYEDGRWVQEPQPATLQVIATFKKSGQAEAVRKHCTN